MDQQVLKLLRKYIDDRCTPQELEQVKAILQSNRHEEEWSTVLQDDAQRSMDEDAPEALDDDSADQLFRRIVEGTDTEDSSGQPPRRLWYAAAASILFLITAGISILTITNVFEAANTSTVVTAAGEQEEVILPDGSRVWLNDLSQLSYPEKFEGDTRNVELKGRAFFDISSNLSKPFMVETAELTVRVLGTSFDVSAYENDRDMTVAVASGSVRVAGPSFDEETQELLGRQPRDILFPGDRLTYDTDNKKYLRQRVSLNDIRSLHEGQLVFQNRALGDIARSLERRYDISFRFGDEVSKKQRLTFKPNRADLNEVLQVLSLVSGLEYKRNGREVVMREK